MQRSTGANRIVLLLAFSPAFAFCAQHPGVQDLINKSVAANEADFKAAPDFNYEERDATRQGSKTYQVTMIDGSPYQRLIAVTGKPLSQADAAREQQKMQQAISGRRAESSEQRRKRIAKFNEDRRRDQLMMQQLTEAFNFAFIGQRKMRGFRVYMLKATPRPGYKPPNMETQVLPGMEGQLWIDQKTFQWVKVTAQVIHPVSIEGFLAKVEPGTQFELEKSPVGDGRVWQITHFSMRSNAKVLLLFHHASQENDTYFNYQRMHDSANTPSSSQLY